MMDDSKGGPLPKTHSYNGQHERLRKVCRNTVFAHRGSATIVTIASYATPAWLSVPTIRRSTREDADASPSLNLTFSDRQATRPLRLCVLDRWSIINSLHASQLAPVGELKGREKLPAGAQVHCRDGPGSVDHPCAASSVSQRFMHA